MLAALLAVACGADKVSKGAEVLVCGPSSALAKGKATVSFRRDVLPFFSRYGCSSIDCHGGPFPQSSYDLTGYATLFGPGAQAARLKTCNVIPGNAQESYLIEKLEGRMARGDRMPLGMEPMAAQELQLLRTWIDEGARDN
ncbi:MAG: hypothetical protein HYW07_22820 [Candidatus Latescibacteria bacterium]|nr:hypothetical protein [Candidatus Latescibacterota bacterium]